jgi:hypothetical protein
MALRSGSELRSYLSFPKRESVMEMIESLEISSRPERL